jgi:hypothetical protein
VPSCDDAARLVLDRHASAEPDQRAFGDVPDEARRQAVTGTRIVRITWSLEAPPEPGGPARGSPAANGVIRIQVDASETQGVLVIRTEYHPRGWCPILTPTDAPFGVDRRRRAHATRGLVSGGSNVPDVTYAPS